MTTNASAVCPQCGRLNNYETSFCVQRGYIRCTYCRNSYPPLEAGGGCKIVNTEIEVECDECGCTTDVDLDWFGLTTVLCTGCEERFAIKNEYNGAVKCPYCGEHVEI